MSDGQEKLREALDGLDESKRQTLRRLITSSAFVVPAVTSFAMQSLAIRPAEAASSGLGNLH
jgi:hypothetical protein